MTNLLKLLLTQMEEGKKITRIDEFERLVRSFQMECSWTTTNVEGKNLVMENWTSKTVPIFALTRVFDIDSPLFNEIPEDKKRKLLQSILDKEILEENYERAAVLRDVINSL
jgi:hypothetical protein